jgi:hypothetical protein
MSERPPIPGVPVEPSKPEPLPSGPLEPDSDHLEPEEE